jgi:hypothetical protein
MQKSYSEGLAIHTGPESCGYAGNGLSEALTGVHAGWVLSRESIDLLPGVPTLSKMSEGNTECLDMARGNRAPRGRRPHARMETLCTGTGRSHVRPNYCASGKVRTVNPNGVIQ